MNLTRSFFRPATLHRQIRTITTLPSYINQYPTKTTINSHILTLLRSPNPALALGTTTSIPPTPSSFTPNESFLPILHSVLRTHSIHDPYLKSQASTYASESGFSTTSTRSGRGSSGAGPTAYQGGSGSGGSGRGGWIHISDSRKPPDWGRIADPEDIFGSLEVDSDGQFVKPDGNYSESGTYRILTPDGILGLSPFLLEKLTTRLKELDQQKQSY